MREERCGCGKREGAGCEAGASGGRMWKQRAVGTSAAGEGAPDEGDCWRSGERVKGKRSLGVVDETKAGVSK